jgi:hypothetical protein
MNDLYEHKAKKYKYKYLKLKRKIEYMGEGGVALGSLRSGLKYLTSPSTWKFKTQRDRERETEKIIDRGQFLHEEAKKKQSEHLINLEFEKIFDELEQKYKDEYAIEEQKILDNNNVHKYEKTKSYIPYPREKRTLLTKQIFIENYCKKNDNNTYKCISGDEKEKQDDLEKTRIYNESEKQKQILRDIREQEEREKNELKDKKNKEEKEKEDNRKKNPFYIPTHLENSRHNKQEYYTNEEIMRDNRLLSLTNDDFNIKYKEYLNIMKEKYNNDFKFNEEYGDGEYYKQYILGRLEILKKNSI